MQGALHRAPGENLDVIRQRFGSNPNVTVDHLDLDGDLPAEAHQYDVVYCYGVLYHLSRPAEALAWMCDRAVDLLLLETCVSYSGEDEPFLVSEGFLAEPGDNRHGVSAFARVGDEPTEGEDAARICDRYAAPAPAVSTGLAGERTDSFHRFGSCGVCRFAGSAEPADPGRGASDGAAPVLKPTCERGLSSGV